MCRLLADLYCVQSIVLKFVIAMDRNLIAAILSVCTTVAALLQLHIVALLHLIRQQQENRARYQKLMKEKINLSHAAKKS